MWILTGLFSVRVAGQLIQYCYGLLVLPPFEDFQGSSMPYGLLLGFQIFLLALMTWTSWSVQQKSLLARPKLGKVLRISGWIYLSGSVIRLVVGIFLPGEYRWFHAWIPGVFHIVLATFVLQAACYHLRPTLPSRRV